MLPTQCTLRPVLELGIPLEECVEPRKQRRILEAPRVRLVLRLRQRLVVEVHALEHDDDLQGALQVVDGQLRVSLEERGRLDELERLPDQRVADLADEHCEPCGVVVEL